MAQFEYPEYFSTEAKDLISNILTPNPNKRFSLAQIKAHPWIKDPEVVSGASSFDVVKRPLEKSVSKELAELNSVEYIPAKMDAFEFASYCTGRLLNGLFELKHISPAAAKEDPDELQTEIVTSISYKEYLPVVLFAANCFK